MFEKFINLFKKKNKINPQALVGQNLDDVHIGLLSSDNFQNVDNVEIDSNENVEINPKALEGKSLYGIEFLQENNENTNNEYKEQEIIDIALERIGHPLANCDLGPMTFESYVKYKSLIIEEILFGRDGVQTMATTQNSKYTEDWLPVNSIMNGMIILDNKWKVTGVKINPRNIFILDQATQDSILISLKNLYNMLDFEFWIVAADKPVDISLYLSQLQLLYNQLRHLLPSNLFFYRFLPLVQLAFHIQNLLIFCIFHIHFSYIFLLILLKVLMQVRLYLLFHLLTKVMLMTVVDA